MQAARRTGVRQHAAAPYAAPQPAHRAARPFRGAGAPQPQSGCTLCSRLMMQSRLLLATKHCQPLVGDVVHGVVEGDAARHATSRRPCSTPTAQANMPACLVVARKHFTMMHITIFSCCVWLSYSTPGASHRPARKRERIAAWSGACPRALAVVPDHRAAPPHSEQPYLRSIYVVPWRGGHFFPAGQL